MGRHCDSPVSNDGRGLKRDVRDGKIQAPKDSPVSNDGRGLKPLIGTIIDKAIPGFARQQ